MKQIKNFVTGATMVLFLLGIFGWAGNFETHYNATGNVKTIENGHAVIYDDTGNIWEYKDDSLRIGDKVKLKIFNNGTDTIKHDDVIEKVTKVLDK